jgi:2-polyprenyl-6-methoxyphenol hydroxylase-like FAD-dependent oxidoreductase
MAGLLASRVLCTHFERVTLIERDDLSEQPEHRKGVPQARHLHVLHARGELILERLFPGLSDDLTKAGATRIDIPGDLVWYHLGGYNLRYKSGLTQLAMSRPLVESQVRHRVLETSNLKCHQRHDVVGLLASETHERICGVTVRARSEDGPEKAIMADLVVDATGRGSRSPAWLESLGYAKPSESAIKIGYGYTTRLYKQDSACLSDAKAIFIQPTPPHIKRLGGLFPIEGGRWIVTLGGYKDHHAPADEQGFLEHARSLSAPELYQVLRRAEPLSDFVSHGLPSNLRRHYEKMRRFPDGYLVIGDAMCSFNPVYGQGMTVSAIEAEILDRCLSEMRSRNAISRLAGAYFRRAARAIDGPWRVAAGEDFRYSGIEGDRAPGTGIINWYVGHVHRATHSDAVVSDALIKVMMLVDAPPTLFHPRIVLPLLKDHLFRHQRTY